MLIYILFVFLVFISLSFKSFAFSYESYSQGLFTLIDVLVVDPKEYHILPVRASCKNTKRETVKALANRYGAVAAINGGFWKPNGDPAGILKINHQWHGASIKPRGAIGWTSNGQKVLIDRLLTNYNINHSTQDKIEVLPESMSFKETSDEWKELDHIVGGTPVLIKNGNPIQDYSSENTMQTFLTWRHPRTAVGVNEKGHWVFVVVSCRFCRFLGGMTIKQLSQLMLKLGCTEALNLDGGGSSTMVINREVVNKPRGKIKENRKRVQQVSDAILILPLLKVGISRAHTS